MLERSKRRSSAWSCWSRRRQIFRCVVIFCGKYFYTFIPFCTQIQILIGYFHLFAYNKHTHIYIVCRYTWISLYHMFLMFFLFFNYMYSYIYIYIYMYVYMYTFTCNSFCICTHTYTSLYTYSCMYIDIRVLIYIFVYWHTYSVIFIYSRRFATATARTALLGSHSRGMIQGRRPLFPLCKVWRARAIADMMMVIMMMTVSIENQHIKV